MRFLTIAACAFAVSVSASVSPLRRDMAQLITSCTVSNTAALTFDDGPHIYMYVNGGNHPFSFRGFFTSFPRREIVDVLKAAGGKGTFFVNGDNWGCIYDESRSSDLKYAYDNGFQIGSHTWAHKDLSTLSHDDINQEMSRTEDAIRSITGAIPAFTRPPFGSYNDEVLNVAGSRSQTVVNWDVDSGDSLGTDPSQQKQVYADAVGRHPDNILSLQHEVYESTAHDVLPYAIGALQGAGYQLVTLAECLGRTPYLSVGEATQKDDTWQCSK